MLTRRTESITVATMIAKLILNIIVLSFSVWIVFFLENSSYPLMQGVVIFLALSLTMGVFSQIPFGLVFAPILIEWWWLDIELSEISTIAWSLVVVSIILDGLLIRFVMRDSSTRGREI